MDLCSTIELIGTVALAAACRAPAPAVVVHEQAHTLTVWVDGSAATVPVGLGAVGWETPLGTFRLLGAYAPPSPEYGPAVVLTSAKGRVDGTFSGDIAIHGDLGRPDLVPGNPSHGCIRTKNPEILLQISQLPADTYITITE